MNRSYELEIINANNKFIEKFNESNNASDDLKTVIQLLESEIRQKVNKLDDYSNMSKYEKERFIQQWQKAFMGRPKMQ